jgi:hypothetical protein
VSIRLSVGTFRWAGAGADALVTGAVLAAFHDSIVL